MKKIGRGGEAPGANRGGRKTMSKLRDFVIKEPPKEAAAFEIIVEPADIARKAVIGVGRFDARNEYIDEIINAIKEARDKELRILPDKIIEEFIETLQKVAESNDPSAKFMGFGVFLIYKDGVFLIYKDIDEVLTELIVENGNRIAGDVYEFENRLWIVHKQAKPVSDLKECLIDKYGYPVNYDEAQEIITKCRENGYRISLNDYLDILGVTVGEATFDESVMYIVDEGEFLWRYYDPQSNTLYGIVDCCGWVWAVLQSYPRLMHYAMSIAKSEEIQEETIDNDAAWRYIEELVCKFDLDSSCEEF